MLLHSLLSVNHYAVFHRLYNFTVVWAPEEQAAKRHHHCHCTVAHLYISMHVSFVIQNLYISSSKHFPNVYVLYFFFSNFNHQVHACFRPVLITFHTSYHINLSRHTNSNTNLNHKLFLRYSINILCLSVAPCVHLFILFSVPSNLSVSSTFS